MQQVKKNLLHILANCLSFFLSLIVITPIFVLLINSFKTAGEANSMSLALPKVWMVENYKTVIEQGKLVTSFLNGFFYAICSVTIIVAVVSAAAFVIGRNREGVNRFIYYYIIAGIAMPINTLALMKVMQLLQLMNTRLGIILIYAAINIPLSLFLSYGFVETIPREIDEAAIIDGCKPFQLFRIVILPLFKPILSTLFVLNFMTVWNDFMMPLYYLNNSNKWPMTLAVYNFFGVFENSWNLVSADIILTLVPVLIIFILGQKYIVGGVAAGSVKG
ncbi:carbohydrate ABC transporter permease [Konateibacter massiliensis]|uniref:carbohydrate ABC transporter permease n=1 Tax=Konateibacter massiliensis TaxID=2002841 RepID=UPI000C1591EA|nr:carbohydrate ABC transporter permease [Konateibacter massiliensis]